MAAQKGPNLRVKQGDGGDPTETFTLVAGIRAKTIRRTGDRIDVTTDEDINTAGFSQRTYIPGILDFEITGSGVAKDATSSKALVADVEAGTTRNYEIEWVGVGVWDGPMFMASFEVTGEVEGAITFNFTLSANGAVDWTPAV